MTKVFFDEINEKLAKYLILIYATEELLNDKASKPTQEQLLKVHELTMNLKSPQWKFMNNILETMIKEMNE